ncbi:hypothetical protein [Euzebya sp.]|uniref:hypothetical protein n=1 Tax=Euzebya sp. TaxID=1971409 RepID=UPI0035189B11
MSSRKQSIANPERGARVVVGAGLAVLGVVVFTGGPALWAFVGALLAVAAGLDLVVTRGPRLLPAIYVTATTNAVEHL